MKKTTRSFLAVSSLFLASLPNLAFAETGQTDVNITINQSLLLTLSTNELELGSDPGLNTKYMTVTGATNSPAGFSISFNANNPYNDLKHENATVQESIPSLTEDKTAADFPETAWGYTLETENQTFKKIPIVAENIFSTDENGQAVYDFGLGAKVAADQAAGQYENELIFTIVANPIPPKILYMQDVATWKDTLEEEQQVQAVDRRDGKTYWVAKLKDGNIWMTQNLDLDLSTETTLTPEDSDVTENWTPIHTTVAGAANLKGWVDNYYKPSSFDPGDYYFDGVYNTSECNYLETTCDHFATIPYESNGEHGHLGNYYNWSAAVASNYTGEMATETDAESSICPKGWRLPRGCDSTQENDFERLNMVYGNVKDSDSILLAGPLFFARGGSITSSSLSSYDYGYWTSTASDIDSFADNLAVFVSGNVYTVGDDFRSLGYSVRCVAR